MAFVVAAGRGAFAAAQQAQPRELRPASGDAWPVVPRERLRDVVESLGWGMAEQAIQQLDDLITEFPNSPDPVAMRAVECLRAGKRDAAAALLAKFGERNGALAPKRCAALDGMRSWIDTRPAGGKLRAAARDVRAEVFGDPTLAAADFATAARVL